MQLSRFIKSIIVTILLLILTAYVSFAQNGISFYDKSGTPYMKPTSDPIQHPDKVKDFDMDYFTNPDKLLGELKFNWFINSGFGVDVLGGKTWYPFILCPIVQGYKGQLVLDLSINFDADFEARSQDWDGGNAAISKILFFNWGKKDEDPMRLMWGPIPAYTLGHGTIMKRYTNMGSYPDIQKRGTTFEADLYYSNIQFIVADWYMRDVWGSHIDVFPLRVVNKFAPFNQWYLDDILSKTKIGTTLVWDSRASEVPSVITERALANPEDSRFIQPIKDGKVRRRSLYTHIASLAGDEGINRSYPSTDLSATDPTNTYYYLNYGPIYTKKTFVWGLDLEVPVWLDENSIDVTVYYDHNRIDDLASGNHFGVFGHIVPKSVDIGYRFELIADWSGGYAPRYFNSQYELNKSYQYMHYKTYHEAVKNSWADNILGWLVEFDRTFFDDKLGTQFSIDRNGGDGLDTHMFFAVWLTRLVPGLTFTGFWDRYEIHKFDDIMKEEPLNTRMGTEFAYQISQNVELSIMYTKGFRFEEVVFVDPLNPTVERGPVQVPQKIQTTSIQTRVKF